MFDEGKFDPIIMDVHYMGLLKGCTKGVRVSMQLLNSDSPTGCMSLSNPSLLVVHGSRLNTTSVNCKMCSWDLMGEFNFNIQWCHYANFAKSMPFELSSTFRLFLQQVPVRSVI